ncbi:MAG: hypothetical protein A2Z14_03055 [Chloroflexi bacterium RBG_16_48_8]|nr:MAG: hypothetical protein A2Z14_03055 [Chloroflexi bacterium RBG_16_48_8]
MAERINRKNKSTDGKRKQLPFGLCLVVSLLLVGCSIAGGDPASTTSSSSGGKHLPPAWTPTPISIPGTGLDAGTWQPCDDAPPSQLEVGDMAVVEGTSFKLRLRGEPSLMGTLAGEIEPGDIVEIFNGPNCSDKMVWWEIRSVGAGQSGWTAEGNDYNTWLVRID